MCQNNQQSLEITYNDFSTAHPSCALWLAEEPALMLPILNEVAFEVLSEVYP